MDRHVIDALLGLLFDHFKHDVDVEVFHAANAVQGLINRHCADRHRGFRDDSLADLGNIAARGEVHHGVGAELHRVVELVEFAGDVGSSGGVADIGVDLTRGPDADAHGLKGRVVDVGGDDHATAGDFVAHEFRSEAFALGDELHLAGDLAFAGIVHLGPDGIGPAGICPLFAHLVSSVTLAGAENVKITVTPHPGPVIAPWFWGARRHKRASDRSGKRAYISGL